MEYDLLSKSILILTHGYPKENPPTTEVTLTNGDKSYTEIKPILSLIAIDEASGRPVTPGTVGPTITGGPYYTVTFCSTCNLRPDPNLTLGFQFLYDYTDTYSNTSTFDQVTGSSVSRSISFLL